MQLISFSSIVLLAVADAKFRFLFVDVGGIGASNDSGLFQASDFGKALETGCLNLPQQPHAAGIQHHFLADDAFKMSVRVVKPFPSRGLTQRQKIFNTRLTHARKKVECSFGILSSRFRILLCPILQHYDNACKTIKAACVLHNFLLEKSPVSAKEVAEVEPIEAVPLQRAAGNRAGNLEARAQRERITDYFVTGDGQTEWQLEKASMTSHRASLV